MKKLFPFLLLLISLISCQKKHQDVIEIYLTKERIPNKVGIPIQEYLILNKMEQKELEFHPDKFEFMTVDTIQNQLIELGAFNFEITDLEHFPFITNEEILGFDDERAELFFKNQVIAKFSKLEYNSQFVLFINKKPIINGYLQTGFSSRRFNETYIGLYTKPNKEKEPDTFSIILLYGDIESKASVPDFKILNPEFDQAFQTRNQENNLFQQ